MKKKKNCVLSALPGSALAFCPSPSPRLLLTQHQSDSSLQVGPLTLSQAGFEDGPKIPAPWCIILSPRTWAETGKTIGFHLLDLVAHQSILNGSEMRVCGWT